MNNCIKLTSVVIKFTCEVTPNSCKQQNYKIAHLSKCGIISSGYPIENGKKPSDLVFNPASLDLFYHVILVDNQKWCC